MFTDRGTANQKRIDRITARAPLTSALFLFLLLLLKSVAQDEHMKEGEIHVFRPVQISSWASSRNRSLSSTLAPSVPSFVFLIAALFFRLARTSKIGV